MLCQRGSKTQHPLIVSLVAGDSSSETPWAQNNKDFAHSKDPGWLLLPNYLHDSGTSGLQSAGLSVLGTEQIYRKGSSLS